MCGIVGLLIKDPSQRERLGEFVTPMLCSMGERGPDSAGLAVFEARVADAVRRFSLFCEAPGCDWTALGRRIEAELGAKPDISFAASAAEFVAKVSRADLQAWLSRNAPHVHLLSVGKSMRLVKDEGHPREIAKRYGFERLAGSHAVGHTRMATESAVSPLHAHPFRPAKIFAWFTTVRCRTTT